MVFYLEWLGSVPTRQCPTLDTRWKWGSTEILVVSPVLFSFRGKSVGPNNSALVQGYIGRSVRLEIEGWHHDSSPVLLHKLLRNISSSPVCTSQRVLKTDIWLHWIGGRSRWELRALETQWSLPSRVQLASWLGVGPVSAGGRGAQLACLVHPVQILVNGARVRVSQLERIFVCH